jgi:hypothetical protein
MFLGTITPGLSNAVTRNGSPTGFPFEGSKWIPHTLKKPPRRVVHRLSLRLAERPYPDLPRRRPGLFGPDYSETSNSLLQCKRMQSCTSADHDVLLAI